MYQDGAVRDPVVRVVVWQPVPDSSPNLRGIAMRVLFVCSYGAIRSISFPVLCARHEVS
jgi:hypothetical protein